jgi:hypothetical protein
MLLFINLSVLNKRPILVMYEPQTEQPVFKPER